MILDEATSSLDTKSENIIQKALDNISKKNITTLTIAHRLSTIKNSDVIYVLKNVNILEKGNHETLLQKRGYYAKLISSLLLEEEIQKHNKMDDYLAKKSSIKKVNSED